MTFNLNPNLYIIFVVLNFSLCEYIYIHVYLWSGLYEYVSVCFRYVGRRVDINVHSFMDSASHCVYVIVVQSYRKTIAKHI